MRVSKLPSFTPRDLARLRQLVASSRVNGTKYSWIHLVDTQSMSPSLDGDIDLLIEWTQPYKYHHGDLIVISKPDLPFLVVHRACLWRTGIKGQDVLQIADQFIFANKLSASWVDLQDVLGRVVQIRHLCDIIAGAKLTVTAQSSAAHV